VESTGTREKVPDTFIVLSYDHEKEKRDALSIREEQAETIPSEILF
jgi:hypothetical protein